jgi:energy-coupling factor transporter ATP-binding protein EcfA2
MFPFAVSGGEGQRVALARALAARPRLLLLDEPAARMDLDLGEAMMARLLDLHRELGMTTLCVTHQFDPPMKTSDRGMLMDHGRVLYDGPLGDLGRGVAPRAPFIEALRRRMGRIE